MRITLVSKYMHAWPFLREYDLKEPMTQAYTITKRDRCKIIFHLNQTPISRKNHLVTRVRWLGIVHLVILKDLKLSNLLKISFSIGSWNELCNNFYIYGLLEDHSCCFLSVYT